MAFSWFGLVLSQPLPAYGPVPSLAARLAALDVGRTGRSEYTERRQAMEQKDNSIMFFEGAKLLGSAVKRLPLATRAGNDIPNEIIPEPDAVERWKMDHFVKLYGARWEPRKPHGGIYNCAGHVWASRRTAILEDDAVRLILADDGYRPLGPAEDVLQGDLVLYWAKMPDGREIFLHVGMVCEIRPGPGSVRFAWVISKWGATSCESLHRYDDVPYARQGFSLRIEFRTDRP
jgi:hypothetical protein